MLAQIEKEEQRKVTEPEQNTISDFQIKVADLSLEDERVSGKFLFCGFVLNNIDYYLVIKQHKMNNH